MPLEQLLDRARIHVLAAAGEHVVHASDEVEPALLVAEHHVARPTPAVDDLLAGELGASRYPSITPSQRTHSSPGFASAPPSPTSRTSTVGSGYPTVVRGGGSPRGCSPKIAATSVVP